MKAAPKLKQLVEELAHKHGFDLEQTGAYLCFELDRARLILENIGASRISIAYQQRLFDEWVADPEIVVWLDCESSWDAHPSDEWSPLEINQMQGGWQSFADLDPNGDLEELPRSRGTSLAG